MGGFLTSTHSVDFCNTTTLYYHLNCNKYFFTIGIRNMITFFSIFRYGAWICHIHWFFFFLARLNRTFITSNNIVPLLVSLIIVYKYHQKRSLTIFFSFNQGLTCAFIWPCPDLFGACATVHAEIDLSSNLQIFSFSWRDPAWFRNDIFLISTKKNLLLSRASNSCPSSRGWIC